VGNILQQLLNVLPAGQSFKCKQGMCSRRAVACWFTILQKQLQVLQAGKQSTNSKLPRPCMPSGSHDSESSWSAVQADWQAIT
jgi:hypothetical protein